jgi:hypothetical protein
MAIFFFFSCYFTHPIYISCKHTFSHLTNNLLLELQSTLPQRGGEVNVTLGGIDLNNSGRYLSHLSLVIPFSCSFLLCVFFVVHQ